MTRGRPDGKWLNYASTGDGVNGPSYFDVRDLTCQLEREFGCRVHFILDPEDSTQRWKSNRMWIRARAYQAGAKARGDVWAGAALGGNSGSSTMPAAMLAALLELWDRCQANEVGLPET